MTDIKKRTWRLYPLLAPQLEALGIAHCSRNEQPNTLNMKIKRKKRKQKQPIILIHRYL